MSTSARDRATEMIHAVRAAEGARRGALLVRLLEGEEARS
jgi:hypothetical protein